MERNSLAIPIPMADKPLDWLRCRVMDERNMRCWAKHADIEAWRERSRVDRFSGMLTEAERNPTPAVAALLARFAETRPPGLARIEALFQAV